MTGDFRVLLLLYKIGSTQPLKPILSLMANPFSSCVAVSDLGVGGCSYSQNPVAGGSDRGRTTRGHPGLLRGRLGTLTFWEHFFHSTEA